MADIDIPSSPSPSPCGTANTLLPPPAASVSLTIR
jgi:hypothetical protein